MSELLKELKIMRQSFLESDWRAVAILDNVIELVEAQPPQLNPDQQILLIYMKDTNCETDDPLEPISDLFLEGTPSSDWESCLQATYKKLSKEEKLLLAQEYIRQELERCSR